MNNDSQTLSSVLVAFDELCKTTHLSTVVWTIRNPNRGICYMFAYERPGLKNMCKRCEFICRKSLLYKSVFSLK